MSKYTKRPDFMSKNELRLRVIELEHLIERVREALDSKPIVSREYRIREILE